MKPNLLEQWSQSWVRGPFRVREALSGGRRKKFSVYNFPINYKKKLFNFYTTIRRKTSRLRFNGSLINIIIVK